MAQLVGGRYRVIAHLGGGAITEVSLAETDAKSDVGKLSVVKRLKLGADAEPEVYAQFADEARLAKRLNHPNIVQTFEAGEDAEGPFLVLEYLEGQTLARIRSRATRRKAGVPRAIALHMVGAVAAGLAYAHALKDQAGKPLEVVHRNVSPEKIIVTYAGATKLIDFSGAPAMASKSRAVAAKKNVAYMAPEQEKSSVKLDARADVFAMGLILWELLAGKRMWEGLSEGEVLARLADPNKPLPTLRSVVPDISPVLDKICSQALAKVRDDRFDSAAELHEAIEKATSAPELRTTTRDVAELVTSLFEDEREKMRATVEDAVGRSGDSARALPRIGTTRPAAANSFVDVESGPTLPVAASPGTASAAPAKSVEVLRVEQAPSPDRRFALLVGGAVLIAFAVVAIVALTHESKPEVTAPVATAPRPSPTPSASDPAASAWVEPEEVTIEISLTPSTGRLFVDGVKATSHPHRVKLAKGKFVHEVRAEADGFETRSMNVVFDRDRSIDIALTPKPGVGVAPRGPAPATSAPTPPAADAAPPSP